MDLYFSFCNVICRRREGRPSFSSTYSIRSISNKRKCGFSHDALACNSKFINHCIELGIDAVIRVKQNNNNSIKQVKRMVNKKEKAEVWEYDTERIEAYEAGFYVNGVAKSHAYAVAKD